MELLLHQMYTFCVGGQVVNEPDYTEIRDERIRGKINDLLLEMFDSPNEYGIYPTSRFMWKMETFILEEKS